MNVKATEHEEEWVREQVWESERYEPAHKELSTAQMVHNN